MNERIYLSDIQKDLLYKDRRSVRRWCRNNGVCVFSDFGSNRLFVLKEEFEAVKMKQAVNYIKEKYGADKLPEYFNSTMLFFSNNNNVGKANKYKPQGEHEKNFLFHLQNI